MAGFVDIDIYTSRIDAEARALAYQTGPGRREKVQLIEAARVLVHDSRTGGQRLFDSGNGRFYVVKSEG